MSKESLKSFGGELEIINKIIRPLQSNKELIVGPGDDCAVIKNKTSKNYTLISSDMYTNGDHFSDDYFTPIQIGSKCMEASFSDIAAMGGKPKYALVNISLKTDMAISFVRSIFRGFYKSCDFHGAKLIGGDIVKAPMLYISVTVIGEVNEKYLKLRKGAQVGDLIKVTGHLGGAAAGYGLLKRRYHGHAKTKKCHTEPHARIDLVDKINPFATSMQDISDGVGSELHHICAKSKTGALVYEEKIPIHDYVVHSARAIKLNHINLALRGGEDYELIYTINPKDDKNTPGWVIGEITEEKCGIKLLGKDNETESPLRKGFQHF